MGVNIKLRQLAITLHASFWFLPTLMVLGAATLAVLVVAIDMHAGFDLSKKYPRLFAVTAEGSREILGVIASSMITVAGVTFSITIVTLSLASSQYTSRVLRRFLRDRGNQMVLGVFVAVHVYCLIVLFMIRSNGHAEFVPPLAVLLGVVLAFCGIGFLIYFIHHVAHSIQVSTILTETADETIDAIDQMFPEGVGDAVDEGSCAVPEELAGASRWEPIIARYSGYIQDMDGDQLLRLAEEKDVVLRMQRSVGDFVVESTPLASVRRLPGSAPLDAEEISRRIHLALAVSIHRTIEKDPGFGVRQMVDVAMKALSPGVNDTTTANICLDHLTVVLARLIQRRLPSPCRSTNGRLRMVIYGPFFADLLGECYEQIRQNAGGNVRVLAHLLHSIHTIAPLTRDRQRLMALRQQVELAAEVIERTVPAPADRGRLLEQCQRTRNFLDSVSVDTNGGTLETGP